MGGLLHHIAQLAGHGQLSLAVHERSFDAEQLTAEFVVSAPDASQFPRDRLPEIAFVGRSNVGKSSLLNTLLRNRKHKAGSAPIDRKQLAQVSRTPGRTRTLNFYRIDQAFYFVDLPGYGYAKISRQVMAEWRKLAESYFR